MKILSVSRTVGKCKVHAHQSAEGCLDVAPLHIFMDSVEPWNRHARSKLLLRNIENAVADGPQTSAHVFLS